MLLSIKVEGMVSECKRRLDNLIRVQVNIYLLYIYIYIYIYIYYKRQRARPSVSDAVSISFFLCKHWSYSVNGIQLTDLSFGYISLIMVTTILQKQLLKYIKRYLIASIYINIYIQMKCNYFEIILQ